MHAKLSLAFWGSYWGLIGVLSVSPLAVRTLATDMYLMMDNLAPKL